MGAKTVNSDSVQICTESEFTVFAPTNAAFDALPEGVLESLLADVEQLTQVLRYHVAFGTFLAADLTPLTALDMLSGDEISIQLLLTGLVLNDTVITVSFNTRPVRSN